jgi:predicted nucleic acid-binding protein
VVGLLDVNVLVALLVPEHEHHLAAMKWFTTEAGRFG